MAKKVYLLFFLLIPAIWSCTEESELSEDGITQKYLEEQIERHKVEALVFCCTDCECNREIGHGTDFGFPGNGQVRIRNEYYDIDKIVSYRIETVHDNWEKEIQMILHFG
jgi:hypothetical protein